MRLTIEIPGDPVGKGRPRATRTGRVYTPKATREWERMAALVITTARRGWQVERDTPVRATIDAVKSRPKRLTRRADSDGRIARTTKPDADNVAKAVLDAAQKAAVIHDDAQVAQLEVRSWYAARDEEAAVWLTLEVM